MSPRGVYARTRSVPTCHPDQKYAGNGLCRGCYRAKWRDEHREQLNSAERECGSKVPSLVEYEVLSAAHQVTSGAGKRRSRPETDGFVSPSTRGGRGSQHRAGAGQVKFGHESDPRTQSPGFETRSVFHKRGTLLPHSAEREKRRADPEKYRAMKREWSRRNREQVAAYARGRRAAHKEHVAHLRFGWRLSAFGLTRDEYQALLDRQDGRCAICREQPTGKRLSIDHNHACCSGNYSCGQCVRGLICDRCNRGIGYFRDNPNLMRIAAAYVERARVAQEGVA